MLKTKSASEPSRPDTFAGAEMVRDWRPSKTTRESALVINRAEETGETRSSVGWNRLNTPICTISRAIVLRPDIRAHLSADPGRLRTGGAVHAYQQVEFRSFRRKKRNHIPVVGRCAGFHIGAAAHASAGAGLSGERHSRQDLIHSRFGRSRD